MLPYSHRVEALDSKPASDPFVAAVILTDLLKPERPPFSRDSTPTSRAFVPKTTVDKNRQFMGGKIKIWSARYCWRMFYPAFNSFMDKRPLNDPFSGFVASGTYLGHQS